MKLRVNYIFASLFSEQTAIAVSSDLSEGSGEGATLAISITQLCDTHFLGDCSFYLCFRGERKRGGGALSYLTRSNSDSEVLADDTEETGQFTLDQCTKSSSHSNSDGSRDIDVERCVQ